MIILQAECPHCATINDIGREETMVECGHVRCTCTCSGCDTTFHTTLEYWKWLELDQSPLADSE